MQKSRLIILLIIVIITGRLFYAGINIDSGSANFPYSLSKFPDEQSHLSAGEITHAELELTASQTSIASQHSVEKRELFAYLHALSQFHKNLSVLSNYQLNEGFRRSPFLKYLYPYHNFW